MPRQDYDERVARRRERLEKRATKQNSEAQSRFAESDRMAGMMQGQPILIGHHSEKRHRRDIDKMWTHGRKGLEAHKNAEELNRRADAVGSGGISADDPEAVAKLRRKLEGLTGNRDRMKAVNAAWRKAGKPRPDNAEAWVRVEETLGYSVEEIRLDMARDFMERAPYTYAIGNTGAEITRVKQRIEALQQAETTPDHEPIEGDGWRIWEDKDENRVFISHDAKPPAEIRANIKRHGFRWSRYAGAWSRMLNNSAWHNAEYLATNGLLD